MSNYSDGEIIDMVLDTVGWPAALRDIDYTLGTTYPKWWEDANALQIIHDLELISLGFFFVNRSGYAIWEGRNTRQAEHGTSSATLTNTMIDLDYDLNDRDIYNEIEISAEYQTSTAYATQTPDTDTATATLTRSVFEASPTAYHTILRTAEGITALSWSNPTTTNNHFSVAISSTGSNWCKVAFQYTATPFSPHTETITINVDYTHGSWVYASTVETHTIKVTAEDTTSQTAYGKRTKVIDLPFKLDAQQLAQSLADYYLNYYKQPTPTIKVTLINKSEAILTQQLERTISDMVRIVNTEMGMDTYWYINKERHEIDKDFTHKTVWELTRVSDIDNVQHRTVWILGTSALGTNTTLDVG